MTEPKDDLEKTVGTALSAFEEMKSMVQGFDKKLTDIAPKMDAFDKEKFAKMSTDINDALEASHKANAALEAKAKAEETERKAVEDRLKGMETALNRAVSSSEGDLEAKAKKLMGKRNDLFNEWAKKRSESREGFDAFLERKLGDEPEELKALTTGSDPAGGYLVMPEFGGVINTRVYESSPVRQLATTINVGTDQYEYVIDDGEAEAGWVGEEAARSETTTPSLGKLIIPVNELYANPKATQKMLDDGIVDVEGWLSNKVADIFARTEATAFVSGNGVLKPKGLLSYAAGTTLASQQVEQVDSGTSGAFTYAGLVELQNALKEEYQPNAVFMLKRASNASIMTILDGESRPIFNMQFDKNVGLQPTIMGKPVYFANDMQAVGADALAAVYGDFRRAYVICDRVGVRVLRDPFTAKPYVHFYTTKRVGGAVVNFEAYKIQKLAN